MSRSMTGKLATSDVFGSGLFPISGPAILDYFDVKLSRGTIGSLKGIFLILGKVPDAELIDAKFGGKFQ